MGDLYVCALRESGEIACWGYDINGQTEVPPGKYQAVSAGGSHACGLRESGEISCWGGRDYVGAHADDYEYVDYRQATAQEGQFRSVAAGEVHTCAVRESGELVCWGQDYRSRGGNSELQAPPGTYRSVTAYGLLTCALRESGEIVCWIPGYLELTDGPPGEFRSLHVDEPCGVRESGELVCWPLPRDLGGRAWVAEPEVDTLWRAHPLVEGYRSVSTGEVNFVVLTFVVLETGQIDYWGAPEWVPAELQ